MNVVLVSLFRNSQGYIDRYFAQVDKLQTLLKEEGHTLHLNLAYGDSRDDTQQMLHQQCNHRQHVTLLELNHGGKEYGSTVHEERFKNLATVCNALWARLPAESDVILYVESDLIWQGETLVQLVKRHQSLCSISAQINQHLILSPMVYTRIGSFYDVWAFRIEGQQFAVDAPYHPALQEEDSFIEMDSVGSVFCMDAPLAFKLVWPEDDVVVGLCRKARRAGARIFLDKTLRVHHP